MVKTWPRHVYIHIFSHSAKTWSRQMDSSVETSKIWSFLIIRTALLTIVFFLFLKDQLFLRNSLFSKMNNSLFLKNSLLLENSPFFENSSLKHVQIVSLHVELKSRLYLKNSLFFDIRLKLKNSKVWGNH